MQDPFKYNPRQLSQKDLNFQSWAKEMVSRAEKIVERPKVRPKWPAPRVK